MKHRNSIGIFLLFVGIIIVSITYFEGINSPNYYDIPQILSIETSQEPSNQIPTQFHVRLKNEDELKLTTLPYKHTISTIYPNWYSISPNGTIATQSSQLRDRIIELSNKNTINLIPTITFDTSNTLVSSFLTDLSKQSQLIGNISFMVDSPDFDGIDITVPHVDPAHGEDVTAFIKVLVDTLHTKNKILSITVPFKTGKPEDTLQAKSMDWVALGKLVDQFTITAYDPEGLTPMDRYLTQDQFKDILYYVSSTVPLKKVSLLLPTESTLWENNQSKSLPLPTLRAVKKIASDSTVRDPLSDLLIMNIDNSQGAYAALIDDIFIKKRMEMAIEQNIHSFSFEQVESGNMFISEE